VFVDCVKKHHGCGWVVVLVSGIIQYGVDVDVDVSVSNLTVQSTALTLYGKSKRVTPLCEGVDELPELYIPMMVDTISCEEVKCAIESLAIGNVRFVERITNRNDTFSYYVYMQSWETHPRAIQFREAIQNGDYQVLINRKTPHIPLRVYKKKTSGSSSKYGFNSTRSSGSRHRSGSGKFVT